MTSHSNKRNSYAHIAKIVVHKGGGHAGREHPGGVSYPTARARLTEVLDKLGLGEPPVPLAPPRPPTPPAPAGPPAIDTGVVLRDLAAGRIDVDEAAGLLDR